MNRKIYIKGKERVLENKKNWKKKKIIKKKKKHFKRVLKEISNLVNIFFIWVYEKTHKKEFQF